MTTKRSEDCDRAVREHTLQEHDARDLSSVRDDRVQANGGEICGARRVQETSR